MNLTKFDYAPNPSHSLVLVGEISNQELSKLCPVLVGKLLSIAEKTSSAALYLAIDKATALLDMAGLLRSLGGGVVPEDIDRRAAEAYLFMQVSAAQLAKRYQDGTLDPVYHTGNNAALEAAQAAVAAEKAAKAA